MSIFLSPQTRNRAINAFIFMIWLMLPATEVLAQTVNYTAIESRTIRDFTDDGIPDLIQSISSILEADERPDDARRVVIEYEVPTPLGPVTSAKIRLHQQGWPNDSLDWYVASDLNGNIDIGDWYDTGLIDSGSFTMSAPPVDEIDVTTALQSMITAGDAYFRFGLRMSDPNLGHALFYSQTSPDPPELVVTYNHLDCVPPPSDMVSWWSGDLCIPEDIYGPNDGSYVGFPICSIHWKVGGGALHFDASNPDHVVVPHDPTLDVGVDGFSVDAWVRTGNASGTIMTKGEAPGFQLYVIGGKLGFYACDSSICTSPMTSTTSIDDLAWHHIAVTRTPGSGLTTFTLYVDGVAENTVSLTIGSSDNTEPLLMGAPGGALAPDYFNGQLDEVEYFDRTLDASEVLHLFNADSSGKCKELCTPPPWTGMVAWYPLDETTGSIANEAVNNLDGVHVNAPTPSAGMVADALSFDGFDDRVEVVDDPMLDMSSGVFSVDFWIFPEDVETMGSVIKKGEDSGSALLLSGSGYHFYYNFGHFLAYLQGTGPGFQVDLSPTFTHHADPGVWTFVAITVDLPANEIRLYINGDLAQITPTPPIPGSLGNDAPLQLGGQTTPSMYRSFHGRLDEVEFFDRVLTHTEIQDIWLAGAAGKCKDDIGMPWDFPFCDGADHVTVPVKVCNHSTAARDYLLSLDPLPMGSTGPGGSCSIDGPDQFYDPGPPQTPIPPALALTIPASACHSVPVRIDRPSMMNSNLLVGCYEVTLLETSSGLARHRVASVQDRRESCAVPVVDDTGFQPLDAGNAATILFELVNTSPDPMVLPYELEAFAPNMVDASPTLSLDGQNPGVPVHGLAQLAPGQGTELTFQVQALGEQPFGFQDLVLSSLHEDSKVPLASLGVHRRPSPSVQLSDGSTLQDLSASMGDELILALEVPACASLLTISLSGEEGNADLYLKYGRAPSKTDFDCQSTGSSSNETCQIASPEAGTWYVMVYGQSSYSNLGLEVGLGLAGETDLGISMDNGVSEVRPEDSVTYTVTVSQAGPCGIAEMVVAPNLSQELLDVSFSTDQGTFDSSSGVWSNLHLDMDEVAMLQIRGTVAGDTGGGFLESSVTVAPPDGISDPNATDNTAVDSDPILDLPSSIFADGFESGDVSAWSSSMP